jgi:hypothetical protein
VHTHEDVSVDVLPQRRILRRLRAWRIRMVGGVDRRHAVQLNQ